MAQPKKYVKINGIMKLNPEYKRWKDAQSGPSNTPPVPVAAAVSANALPVVSSMEDYAEMNDNIGEIPLAESTNATIEMIQEPEIAAEAGMEADEMIDKLGELLAKYEIPIGLLNKLMMFSEFESLEFIIDDSGSMTLQTDSFDPQTRRPYTRWAEAQMRLKEMIEVIAFVPFQQLGIEFLNRRDRINIVRGNQSPETVKNEAFSQIDAIFRRGPSGSTPAYEKLQESLLRGQGRNIVRWFFGDGVPNGGTHAIQKIIHALKTRPVPEQNPITFISCTNEDEAVEWMKDAEEVSDKFSFDDLVSMRNIVVLSWGRNQFRIVSLNFCYSDFPLYVYFQVAPYCSESDDYSDEAQEVKRDQGIALPYTRGFHLICQLVAAMNPDDLDAMDESIPFTKWSLDNLLGIVHNEESYRHYFDNFVKAQQHRRIEIDQLTGMPSRLDEIRKNTRWDYQQFRNTQGLSKKISQVQEVQTRLKQASGSQGGSSW